MAISETSFLYFIGGSKGGVGKSILSMILADFLNKGKNRKIILIESDTSNPDVGKTFAHNDDVEVLSLSLDNADGGIELVNYSEANKKDIVINSAARSGEAVEKFGGTLIGSLGELHVVRNTFYSEPQKFALFNGSKTKIEAEKLGATIDLPASLIVLLMICILNASPLLRLWKLCLWVTGQSLKYGGLSLGKNLTRLAFGNYKGR